MQLPGAETGCLTRTWDPAQLPLAWPSPMFHQSGHARTLPHAQHGKRGRAHGRGRAGDIDTCRRAARAGGGGAPGRRARARTEQLVAHAGGVGDDRHELDVAVGQLCEVEEEGRRARHVALGRRRGPGRHLRENAHVVLQGRLARTARRP